MRCVSQNMNQSTVASITFLTAATTSPGVGMGWTKDLTPQTTSSVCSKDKTIGLYPGPRRGCKTRIPASEWPDLLLADQPMTCCANAVTTRTHSE